MTNFETIKTLADFKRFISANLNNPNILLSSKVINSFIGLPVLWGCLLPLGLKANLELKMLAPWPLVLRFTFFCQATRFVGVTP